MLQRIEIDWDIHKLIEAERKGFDELPYLALRRLLGLHEQSLSEVPSVPVRPEDLSGIAWAEDGVRVPHGSLARMKYEYGRQKYEGKFLDGKLVADGRQFDTLSQAASSLALTKIGGKTQLNGWLYWEAQFPGETKWRSLKLLREMVRQGRR